MDALQALTQARSEFESRLATVGTEQWNNPTPCSEWNVHQLVNHMLVGNRMTTQIQAGASHEEILAGFEDDLVAEAGDNLEGAFAALADAVHAGFAADGGLDGTVNHLMGEIPSTMFVGFRVCDYALHAWDLARGLGTDDRLDPTMIEWLWDDCQAMKDSVADTGMFGEGASGTVADDAPLQIRYLDTFGRRP
jgi:uncharacterized protein (TIGR03086 family)